MALHELNRRSGTAREIRRRTIDQGCSSMIRSSIRFVPNGTISGTSQEEATMAITASEARKNLFPLIEQVNDDRQPIEITSKRGDAVLISRADYEALTETAWLLRAPANATRLLESLAEAHAGARSVHELDQ